MLYEYPTIGAFCVAETADGVEKLATGSERVPEGVVAVTDVADEYAHPDP